MRKRGSGPRRLLIHDYGAYPFTAQLARALAERGHEVLYLYGGGVRSPRAATVRRPSDPETLSLEAVALHEPLKSRAGLGRLRQERRYGRALAERIRQFRPDAVLSVPSSLDAQSAALKAARGVDAGFVFWLQDLYSHAIERLLGRRLPVAGKLLATRFARLERSLLRNADGVVAITDDFVPILQRWDVRDGRISVIPNWAPLDEVKPGPKANRWAQEIGVVDDFVLLYAGTLGRKHDPGLLLALADGLPQAMVVVVSEGAGADRLREAEPRKNVIQLGLQPAERMGEMLASADVLVAILDADANVFSVPSKVLTYLAAGRPILAAIPGVNLAAQTIIDAQAGNVVDPADAAGFVSAARDLLDDDGAREAAADAAREYAERMFQIEPITERFETVLDAAVQEGHTGMVHRGNTAGAQ